MKVKFGLQLKFALLFSVLMIGVGVTVISFISESQERLFKDQRFEYALSVARIVSANIDEKELQEYFVKGEMDEHYDELIRQMQQIHIRSKVFYLYVILVENEAEGKYFFDLKLLPNGESFVNHNLGEVNDLESNYPGLTGVLNSKKASTEFDEVPLEDGENLDSVYVPILNEKNEVTAFVGVDCDKNKLTEDTETYAKSAALFLLIVMLVCFCILLLIVRFSVLRPIYRLKRHAQQISDGRFDVELTVHGHDELSEIMEVFNRMSSSIAGHMEEMRRINAAYYRYVPTMVLTLLKKDSIEDVMLGNVTNAMLTVFAFQLSDFDRTIRKKNTKEMIDDINRVLHASIPVVAEHGGMVEELQDAGFTAMYDHGCEAALLSAITVCQRLNHMVLQKQLDRNHAEIGIAYGDVTMGIVGQEKRMEAITVSQYRDVACWLQSIAEQYQAHILITKTTADQIPGFFETYHIRTLGFLYNTNTGYTDRIYDVYDGDPKEEIICKDETRDLFEKGVDLYCTGNYIEARQQFIAVLKRFRRDKAAKEYLYLCEQHNGGTGHRKTDLYFTKME